MSGSGRRARYSQYLDVLVSADPAREMAQSQEAVVPCRLLVSLRRRGCWLTSPALQETLDGGFLMRNPGRNQAQRLDDFLEADARYLANKRQVAALEARFDNLVAADRAKLARLRESTTQFEQAANVDIGLKLKTIETANAASSRVVRQLGSLTDAQRAALQRNTVIGKQSNIRPDNLRPGDQGLLTFRGMDWLTNRARLLAVMDEGRPIRDTDPYVNSGFLGLEHNLLDEAGWEIVECGGYFFWIPPGF